MIYKCNYCDKKFGIESQMVVHLQWAHNIPLPSWDYEELYTIRRRLAFIRLQNKMRKEMKFEVWQHINDEFFKFARSNYTVKPQRFRG